MVCFFCGKDTDNWRGKQIIAVAGKEFVICLSCFDDIKDIFRMMIEVN